MMLNTNLPLIYRLTFVDGIVHPAASTLVLVKECIHRTREDTVTLERGVYLEHTRVCIHGS